jgi:hypothetical protein
MSPVGGDFVADMTDDGQNPYYGGAGGGGGFVAGGSPFGGSQGSQGGEKKACPAMSIGYRAKADNCRKEEDTTLRDP